MAKLADRAAVVVVGGSLAGLRAAESLRRRGHSGPITIVGAEPHPPYDRPPLSKRVLTGQLDPSATELPVGDDLDLSWMRGTAASGLDLDHRRVTLTGGGDVAFDALVIATGAQPTWLPGIGPQDGVHQLRTLDDAMALRDELESGPRVTIVGGGFIGLEVAASCRQRGLEVTVVEYLDVPLARAIGHEMGAVCARLHRDQGVELRTGASVAGLAGSGRVEGVELEGGEVIPADVVVVGVGVAPTTGWLEGSGVDLDDGVVCDESLRVLVGGQAQPDVVAAGDVARWLHHGYGRPVRVEHWTNAAEQGEAAAVTLIEGEEAPAFSPVPYFWSDQYSTKIQFVGMVDPTDEVEVVEGSVDDGRFVATYGRDGRLVGALGFSRPARVMAYRRLLEQGCGFPVPVALRG